MNLNSKVTVFFAAIAVSLVVMLAGISLLAFRTFSISASTDHIRTAAEIVRVHLTESMINGVIDKREHFLTRLKEVKGLAAARVVRSPLVVQQFGEGLASESQSDEIDRKVLAEGKPFYDVFEADGDTLIRGTIPFIATALGTPNCLECHQVAEGNVLGAVTILVSVGA